jgi:hypothetical protein
MNQCPECTCPLCNYTSGEYHVSICWNCGYYESDSPAYNTSPDLFKDMVRKNPSEFIKKFLKSIIADESLQRKRTDGDLTEPEVAVRIDPSIDFCIEPLIGSK